jgi:hypothetical protein
MIDFRVVVTDDETSLSVCPPAAAVEVTSSDASEAVAVRGSIFGVSATTAIVVEGAAGVTSAAAVVETKGRLVAFVGFLTFSSPFPEQERRWNILINITICGLKN